MRRRVEVRVTGVVQGVGFRPFVHARARDLRLVGHVGNDSAGVFIDAEGDPADVARLLTSVGEGPGLAVVEEVTVRELPLGEARTFEVVPSTTAVGSTSIPPDTAVCEDCLAELRDPQDRRHGYPFIACTHCGPRYTIVESLPYDRPGTTMADFPLCAACQAEYDDPSSRRFHAQPTACADCGPQYDMSVADMVATLTAGRILALQGIGGYHLVCDAGSDDAVERLRERKQRGDKPFALMVPGIDVAQAVGTVGEDARATLLSRERPIVLLPSSDPVLQRRAAPGNGHLGVMLPYAPIHHLLFDAGAPRVLVMTSGNLSDEPICTTPLEATERLSAIADEFAHHDRRIHVSCDDSVVRATSSGIFPVRRSRGYAPLPVTLPVDVPPLLAVGGELKTTLAVAQGRHAWLSQHIGDTENLETLALLARTAGTLTELQRVHPEAIVSDAHPGYLSQRWAAQEAERRGVPHLAVQHHHAHLASLLAEHRHPVGEPVLGFTFDGTGYGTDGTIWGGELLLGGYGEVERVGHLVPVALPGGDASVRRPLRTALAHLQAAGLEIPPTLQHAADPQEIAVVQRMLQTGTSCTPTTSMGRLFDAMSAILGVRTAVDYEGQAAIELEALAAAAPPPPDVAAWVPDIRWSDDGLLLDPAPALKAGVAAVAAGVAPVAAARAFHEGLAEGLLRAALDVRDRRGVSVVGLTGGVFANDVLTRACQGRLQGHGFTVLVHRLVPANDGGLALGQVAVVAAGGADEGRR